MEEASISDPNDYSCDCEDAYRAAVDGEVEIPMKFYSRQPNSSIDIWGDTIFHLLALNKHSKAVTQLLNLPMPINVLKTKNLNGNTALHEAVRVGAMEIAKLMVRKEKSLVHDSNHLGETPLYWAAAFGQTKMFRFLAMKARNNDVDHPGLRRNDGRTILHAAVMGEFYRLALEITGRYPDLALARDKDGITALHLLVQLPSSFRSGTYYSDINLVHSTAISLALFKLVIYFCIPSDAHKAAQIDPEDPCGTENQLKPGLPCLGTIDDEKQKHKLGVELAKLLVKRESICMKDNHAFSIGPSVTTNTINDALMVGVRNGIVEVVDVILQQCPSAIELVDENGKNTLHLAAEFCKIGVLKLLKSKDLLTTKMATNVDNKGNTALYLAAKFDDHRQNTIQIPAYKMAVEAAWFKYLMKNSVKWITNIANTMMLIAALVATMNFTAAFSVPGGYADMSGLPNFNYTKEALQILNDYTATALFLCAGAIVASSSTYMSRCQLDDFYVSLPLKHLVAFNCLAGSTVSTYAAFLQALILVSNGEFSTMQWCIAILSAVISVITMIFTYIDLMFSVFQYFICTL